MRDDFTLLTLMVALAMTWTLILKQPQFKQFADQLLGDIK